MGACHCDEGFARRSNPRKALTRIRTVLRQNSHLIFMQFCANRARLDSPEGDRCFNTLDACFAMTESHPGEKAVS